MPDRELTDHEVKIFTVEFKGHKPETRSFKFKLSDASVDYDNDSIDPKGWDLTNFKAAGGPVMFGHDYKSLPIAKDVGASVDGDSLYGYPHFPEKGIHPFADTVYELVKDGFLNAASVGFKPKEHSYNTDRKGFDISKSVLIEYSIVPIGAHPGALVQRAKQKHLDLRPIEEWCTRYLDETYGAPCVSVTREQVEKVFQFITASKTFAVDLTVKGCSSSSSTGEHMKADDTAHVEILDTPEEKFLEIAGPDLVFVDPDQITAAIGQAFKEGLTEAITQTVQARLDYARGRVA
jgi:HK97 family phage prohead protease